MCAFPASVSADNAKHAGKSAVLIVGLNWLGDSIMCMPALQAYQARHCRRLDILVRPHLAPLWRMHPAVAAVRICSGRLPELCRALPGLRAAGFYEAYVLPLSFRSALAPWLAGIERRHGLAGHARDWMLTDVCRLPATPRHQALDYMQLLGVEDAAPPPPALGIPPDLREKWRARLAAAGAAKWVALFPGAAFGPAKRWPAAHFAEAGRRLQKNMAAGIVVLGAPSEAGLCQTVAEGVEGCVLNLAGRTSLTDLAAVLSCCRLALTNDSGGMHLATAVGVPVVAVFGVTDPCRTGPLGLQVRVLQDSERRDRDLGRHQDYAAAALARITPARAVAAALELAAADASVLRT